MGYSAWRYGAIGCGIIGVSILLSGCGSSKTELNQRGQGSAQASADATSATSGGVPLLAQSSTEQVMSTLVIPFGKNAFQLAAAAAAASGTTSWDIDMQDSLPVVGGVAPLKYLKVTGSLTVPTAASNQDYPIGCIYVDLKDNVYYRENTWLRLGTDGIKGETYTDITLPLAVNLGTWQNVPTLTSTISASNSVTINEFASNTIKAFAGTLCFQLDFSNAPADQYKGNIIVQYLRSGTVVNPPVCSAISTDPACEPAPAPTPPATGTGSGAGTSTVASGSGTTGGSSSNTAFSCSSTPQALKAGQTTNLSWANVPAGDKLQFVLAAGTGTYSGQLGTVTAAGNNGAVYTAPATVPADVQITITAQPVGSELLPSFCAVTLAADGQIGVPDDGTLQGLPGNVYVLPVNTPKLPDFSKLTPTMELVVGNLDVPNTYFTSGFPGIPNLTEWFGIRFRGQIKIPANESCSFKLSADDGAILYIDNNVVVNDDGQHAITDAVGAATLTAGLHAFQVDYYQGPRWYIALEAYWQCGTDTDYTIIPPSAFSRPLQ